MAIIYALISFLGWGGGDVFFALASRRFGASFTFFLFLSGSFILGIPLVLAEGFPADAGTFAFALVIGFIHIMGTLAYTKALSRGNVSIVGTIAGSFPIVAVLWAVLLFHESVRPMTTIGIIGTLAGLVLISLKVEDLKNLRVRSLLADSSIRAALFTLFAWGTYFGLVRIPAERIGWFWAAYAENIFFFVPLIMGLIVPSDVKKLTKPKNILFMLAFLLLARGADVSYNLGLLSGFTSVVAPIAGSSPVLFVLLSRFVFREPLSIQQMVGISCSLLGIITIAFSSV